MEPPSPEADAPMVTVSWTPPHKSRGCDNHDHEAHGSASATSPGPMKGVRTPGELAAEAARLARLEAELSAREALAAEREAAAAVQQAEFTASSTSKVGAVLDIAAEAEAAAEAASKAQAANVALAARLDRREAELMVREAREESAGLAAREASVAAREAELLEMATSLREQTDALSHGGEALAARVAAADEREATLNEVHALMRAREEACAAREAQLDGPERAALRGLMTDVDARGAAVEALAAAVEARDQAGEVRAASVTTAAGSLSAVGETLERRAADLARRDAAVTEKEKHLAERAAALQRRHAQAAEREKALDELHDAVEKRQEALGAAAKQHADALESMQRTLLAREDALRTKEAAVLASSSSFEKIEGLLVQQQALLEQTADDRERLAGELAVAERRAAEAEAAAATGSADDDNGKGRLQVELEVMKADNERLRSEHRAETERLQGELEAMTRRAKLTGHVAGSVAEYVRALHASEERVAELEAQLADGKVEVATTASASDPAKASEAQLVAQQQEIEALRRAVSAAERRAAAAEGAAKSAVARVKRQLASNAENIAGDMLKTARRAAEEAEAREKLAVAAAAESKSRAAEEAVAMQLVHEVELEEVVRAVALGTGQRGLSDWVELADQARDECERLRAELMRIKSRGSESGQRLSSWAPSPSAAACAGVALTAMSEYVSTREKLEFRSALCAGAAAAMEVAAAAACAGGPHGGWGAVARTLEAPIEALSVLEHLRVAAAARWGGPGGVSGEDIDGEFGGGILEARVCAAVRNLVGALRAAAAAVAVAEVDALETHRTSAVAAEEYREAYLKVLKPAANKGASTQQQTQREMSREASATPSRWRESARASNSSQSALGLSPIHSLSVTKPGEVSPAKWSAVDRLTTPALARLEAMEASLVARRISMSPGGAATSTTFM